MRNPFVLATLCLALLLGGCSSTPPLDPAVPLNVSVSTSQSLRLRNASSRPIFYVVMERGFASLANWAPCTNPAECPRVDARGETRVDYGRIAGYEPGAREAIVYWWHLVEGDGGWVVDNVRSVVVKL